MAKAYNPFEETADEDLDLLFKDKETEDGKETKEQKAEEQTLEEVLNSLPEGQKNSIKGAFKTLADQIEGLSNKPGIDQSQLIQALVAIQNKPRQTETAPDEGSQAENDVKLLLKELGLEDESKAGRFISALDKLAERKAKNLYEPTVRFMTERVAKEERSSIANAYPEKDDKGNKTGYPSLASCANDVKAAIDRHPSFSLLEAYEYANKERILELRSGKKVEVVGDASGRLTAADVLRKLSLSTEPSNSNTKESVNTTASAKTVKEAMAQAAKELGFKF